MVIEIMSKEYINLEHVLYAVCHQDGYNIFMQDGVEVEVDNSHELISFDQFITLWKESVL